MSPEERDRLTLVEARQNAMEKTLDEIRADVKKLLTAAAMAQGGWWVALKIAGFLLVLAGGVSWLIDRLPWGGQG